VPLLPHAQGPGLDAGSVGQLSDGEVISYKLNNSYSIHEQTVEVTTTLGNRRQMTALASTAGFSAAYRDHYPLAFSAAYRVLGDAAAAEDVVQDVFTALWREPRKFDPQRGSLPGYVAMVARSRAVDRVRSRNAGSAAVDRLAVRDAAREAEVESPAESVVRQEDAGRILSALAELPAAQRDAVLLAYGRDLSTAEIAEAAGVPLGTAKSRLRLGLQRTRQAVSTAAAA
jgi:RNA polymerase sigma-70 factor, ECF subfamily